MGLAEWPVVLIGQIDPEFMDVPPEILQTSMRTHQKYFSLRDPARGKLAQPLRGRLQHGGRRMAGWRSSPAMNAVVCGARLVRTRKFFWDQGPQGETCGAAWAALKDIVFHAKLGTQLETRRTHRVIGGRNSQDHRCGY